MTVQLITANETDPLQLTSFLERFFGSTKANFLRDHGAWLHKDDENRWVLSVDGVIAGYCAVIPARVYVNGQTQPAIWWVDLVLAPEFRKKGLQSLFDKKIKEIKLPKLGFPNERFSVIQIKHNWGVRDDLRVYLCPLRPLSVNQVQASHGWRGFLLKLAALGLIPLTSTFRFWLDHRKPENVFQSDNPSASYLAGVVARAPFPTFVTTCRDEAYFQHRFLDAPYLDQLGFYFSGPPDSPSHYLITRTLPHQGHVVTRVLDFYGDFADQTALRELLLTATADASKKRASQITVMLSLPEIDSVLRSAGFFLKTPARFCWLSDDPDLMQVFNGSIYFTIADSDNDEIA